jgi:hypothetical protein
VPRAGLALNCKGRQLCFLTNALKIHIKNDFFLLILNLENQEQLLTTDLLALATMKNAAKCDK